MKALDPSANHGTPARPAIAYRVIEATPRHMPRAAAVSRTAKVWPVSGTGVKGSGIATCAARPTKAAPATTRTALRTALRPKTSAMTPGAGVARDMAFLLIELTDD